MHVADTTGRRDEHLLDRSTTVKPRAVAVVVRPGRAATIHLQSATRKTD